jgi:hypothetical protein
MLIISSDNKQGDLPGDEDVQHYGRFHRDPGELVERSQFFSRVSV